MIFYKLSAYTVFFALIVKPLETAAASVNKINKLDACKSSNFESEQIKEAFLFAYNGYKDHAWGHDELLPVSKSYSDSR